MSDSFKGKLVVITGAANGIGLAICQHFASKNANIIAIDIDNQALDNLKKSLDSNKLIKSYVSYADITRYDDLKKIIHEAETALNCSTDILVNAAGGSHCPLLRYETEKKWQDDLQLNLTGAFNSVEAVREQMIQKKNGCIIHIGSVNGLFTFGDPSYSTAKAGLISYTKAVAVEFGKYGIRSNIVCPGTVKTQLWTERMKANPDVFEDLRQWYPLGNIVEPEDVANAVAFLASENAKMITGIVLPVDAGLLAGMPAVVESIMQKKL